MKLMSVSVRVSVRVRVSVGVRVRLRVTCSEVPTRRFVDEAPRTALSFAADLRFHCIRLRFCSRFPLLWVILQRCKLFLWTQTAIELTRNSSSTAGVV